MAESKRLLVALTGLIFSFVLAMQTGMTVQAGSTRNYLEELSGGIAAILDPANNNSAEMIEATARELNVSLTAQQEEESTLVMVNVKDVLNVRSDASTEAKKVGKLYKDCGGTILERRDGWTRLQSGNVIGWSRDDYLLFDEEAQELAEDVGRLMATVNTETLRVRTEPGTEASILGLLPMGEKVEAIGEAKDGWVCIDYGGEDGYVSAQYVTLELQIDVGETMEEIKAREAAEKEAKRYKNYGQYTTDADTTMLLAALIHCEARGESYEGQLAVGAVVMNRVRSAAYPDTVHGVIYASGQFSPALNGTLNQVYESGKINESCIRAAKEALSGVSNVGDLTHFRRNDGRAGIVIGNHVFH